MYPYLEIFGRLVPTYMIMALVGLIFALVLALLRRKSGNISFDA